MSGEVIEVRNLRVTSGGKVLLSLPFLSVAPGEVLAVLGPNGAGKTTLLRTLVGFQRARGRVTVLGRPVGRLGPGGLCRLRQRVAYVPQLLVARSEMPLTMREVVVIGRTGRAGLGRRLSRRDWLLADEWMDRLGLGPLAGQRYADCSGGEQRKALIAKAMVQQPELLLLDEPTANLDLRWREQVVAAIEGVQAETGITVVLVCHELEVLPPSCRRVMVLEAGEATGIGTPEQVLTDRWVTAMYGANLTVRHNGARHAVIPATSQVQA